jgi:hypothetical protein
MKNWLRRLRGQARLGLRRLFRRGHHAVGTLEVVGGGGARAGGIGPGERFGTPTICSVGVTVDERLALLDDELERVRDRVQETETALESSRTSGVAISPRLVQSSTRSWLKS